MDQSQATVPECEDQSKVQRKRSEPEPGPEPEPRLISKRRSEIPSVENEEWGRFLKMRERSLQEMKHSLQERGLQRSQPETENGPDHFISLFGQTHVMRPYSLAPTQIASTCTERGLQRLHPETGNGPNPFSSSLPYRRNLSRHLMRLDSLAPPQNAPTCTKRYMS
ncbi:hypothetical protein ATANTOWER_018211 [Ataeniobius toweri]|uniref:Uncharacterized protein n=1 Tax=Ataeniobius toweri TaxID=208326 RepID=A0ABU7BIA2_9TELE|nr:hypothetical protein [Ataeniobius toweri]